MTPWLAIIAEMLVKKLERIFWHRLEKLQSWVQLLKKIAQIWN